jgi:uncharacterized protein with NRDE domain
MCTVIIKFSTKHLLIGANRDEDPNRPSEDWQFRGGIFCPLDVRGGTWTGINKFGTFCAITNWDISETHYHNMESRGKIVLDILKLNNIPEIIKYVAKLDANNYCPFNILFGNTDQLYTISNDHSQIHCRELEKGLHISTGWGLNQNIIREQFIRSNSGSMADILSAHNDGLGSENSICVHDSEHRWETRSSSIIEITKDSWKVSYTNQSPCTTKEWKAQSWKF